ncbi:MAG: oligosaccharide flippase family protein [Crocinitomicaceae bacterium]|jgi:O-antigen/teichoic acid export membrane protein|nr:oligosaccharide flippase family protein [Crocinitomicaceae bacterium]
MSALRKGFIVYTGTNLLSVALPFILLPFLTQYLTQGEYGVLSNFNGLINLLLPVVGINFVSAYSRQYFKKDIDIETYSQTGISFQFLLGVILQFLILLFEKQIVVLTQVPAEYLHLVVLYLVSFNVSEILLAYWRNIQKSYHFAVFRIGRTLFEIILTLLFIIPFQFGVGGRIYAIILAGLIALLPSLVYLKKLNYIGLQWSKEHFQHYMRFGLPLIPHTVSASMLVYSDKLMITNLIGIEANGVYSVAFQVGLILGLVQNSFNQAWVPWFYQALENPEPPTKLKIVKITYLYYLASAVMCLLLVVVSPLIFQLLGKSFAGGQELIIWLSAGFLFNGMYKMMVNYLFYQEKTMTISLVTVLTLIANVVLNYFLIPIRGIEGAAIATTITFVLQFLLVTIFSNHSSSMPWLYFLGKK